MLSDEEKKAIDKLKRSANYFVMPIYETKIILELIEKQSKEIEELKKPKYIIDFKTGEITTLTNDFISKEKIKETLGIEENIDNDKLLSLLQTIVDENARLEDIEDRKVQIEYNNVFNKGVKSVEDKIKAKIEELEKGLEKVEQMNASAIRYDVIQKLEYQIEVLQLLLEKE